MATQPDANKFRNPKLVDNEPAIAPPNTLGLRSVRFTVESVDDTVARLRADGVELVGEVAQYEDKYSATCEVLWASSPRWPRNSFEAFTAFGETDGALGAPSTRSHGSQRSLSRLLAPRFC
jgi:hypothetical protein